MKRLQTFGFCSLFALGALTACNKANVDDPNTLPETGIAFTSNINEMTKVNANNFEIDDKISVFAIDNNNEYYANNVIYNYNGEQFTSNSAIKYPSLSESLSFIALYPHKSYTNEPFYFNIALEQRTQEDIEASDLLVATIDATKEMTPELTFKHKMVEIETVISSSDVDTQNAIIGITALTTASCDLSAQTFVGTGLTNEVIALNDSADGTNFKAIVAPQTIEANSAFICAYIGGVKYSWSPAADLELSSGKSYTCTIAIESQRIMVQSITEKH